jgi:hypothetical protein
MSRKNVDTVNACFSLVLPITMIGIGNTSFLLLTLCLLTRYLVSATTFGITTLSSMGLTVTLSINVPQLNDTQHNL